MAWNCQLIGPLYGISSGASAMVWTTVWFYNFEAHKYHPRERIWWYRFSEKPSEDRRITEAEDRYITDSIGPIQRVKVPRRPWCLFAAPSLTRVIPVLRRSVAFHMDVDSRLGHLCRPYGQQHWIVYVPHPIADLLERFVDVAIVDGSIAS